MTWCEDVPVVNNVMSFQLGDQVDMDSGLETASSAQTTSEYSTDLEESQPADDANNKINKPYYLQGKVTYLKQKSKKKKKLINY